MLSGGYSSSVMIQSIISLLAISQSSANRLLLQTQWNQNPNGNMIWSNNGGSTGYFNQNCQVETNMQCTSTASIARSDSNGFTNCENPSDCCLCSSIQCKPNCDRFVAGDYAAFGVKDIAITGPLEAGATIDCRGDHACANTYQVTQNINQIICGGRYSCQNAQIMVSNPIDGFYLSCGGTNTQKHINTN